MVEDVEGLNINNSSPIVRLEGVDYDDDACWAATYDKNTDTFILNNVNCYSSFRVVCYKFVPSCESSQFINELDAVFDPGNSFLFEKNLQLYKSTFQYIFYLMNMTKSYKSWLSQLWHSSLPCFDTKNVTAAWDGERSLLKLCKWKGKTVPCSAIFNKVLTDFGFCCAFNAKAADEIFNGKTFTNLIKDLQDNDRKGSFENSSLPNWFKNNNEPKSLSGSSTGLMIVIDAHTDQLSSGSVDYDFKGFLGLISAKGEDFGLVSPSLNYLNFLLKNNELPQWKCS